MLLRSNIHFEPGMERKVEVYSVDENVVIISI